jgi:hypothetical protein
MYWLDSTDLRPALNELAAVLGLTITDENLAKLDADLEGTWYSSTYVDGRYVPGPWATLRHGSDTPHFELADDECGGVFVRMWCDDATRQRAVQVLAKFNPLIT